MVLGLDMSAKMAARTAVDILPTISGTHLYRVRFSFFSLEKKTRGPMIFTKEYVIVSAEHIDVYNLVLTFHVYWEFPHFLFDTCSILFKTFSPNFLKVICPCSPRVFPVM